MAVKKTTKKAAKKTYTSAKKTTIPKLRFATLEELAVFMAEDHAKTEAAIRGLSAAIKGLVAQNDRTAALVRELTTNLGHVSNDIGELMEFIVIPKIRLAMNASGSHSFTGMLTDKTFRKIDELGEKKPFTEVDVLLYSDTEVMAVETKSHLTIRDVKKHLERLDILRQNEELVGIQAFKIKGKKLFGALVGAIVDKDVKNFALERGLYVVKIREEENKLDVTEPRRCQTW
jgi:hypothetical protein